MKTISYAANEWGYIVCIIDAGNILEEYHAGNHKNDSHVSVPPGDKYAETPNNLQKMARATALEYAEELGVPKKNVQYDSDLHLSIYT